MLCWFEVLDLVNIGNSSLSVKYCRSVRLFLQNVTCGREASDPSLAAAGEQMKDSKHSRSRANYSIAQATKPHEDS